MTCEKCYSFYDHTVVARCPTCEADDRQQNLINEYRKSTDQSTRIEHTLLRIEQLLQLLVKK